MDHLDATFDPVTARLFKAPSHHSQGFPRSTSMGTGSHSGRSCVQCGATKTPQWREGPAGPKTLCNACGVKRCRQMRLLIEGKRSSAASQKAASNRKTSSDSKSDDCSEELALCGRDGQNATRRPKRKAAARSASRTAVLANTGDWPDEDVDDYLYTSTPSSSARIQAAEDAGCNSDSAEEVTWTPRPRAAANVAPFSPMIASVGLECAAAVNLLSMSIKESELGLYIASANGLVEGATAAALQVMAPNEAAERVAAVLQPAQSMPQRHLSMPIAIPLPAKQDASSYIKQQSQKLTAAMCKVPTHHHASMQAAKDELEEHARQVASADAAVAAVARILAVKQALATRARHMAKLAAKRMQQHLIATTGQDPWERGSKRSRPC